MKKYVSELLGCFFITLAGVGSLLGINFMVSAMGLMLPFGFSAFLSATTLAVTTGLMYYLFNRTSGGHFNPAVTLAVFIEEGVKNIKDLLLYIVFQILGSGLAVGLLVFITGQNKNIGQVGFGELSPLYLSLIPAAIIELIFTILLVLVFLVIKDRRAEGTIQEGGAAVAIGASIFAAFAFDILTTGGGLNPAKILVCGLISGGTAITQLPIFVIVPIVGSIIAFGIFKGLFKTSVQAKESSDNIPETEATEEPKLAESEDTEKVEKEEVKEEVKEEASEEIKEDTTTEEFETVETVEVPSPETAEEIQAKLDQEIFDIEQKK